MSPIPETMRALRLHAWGQPPELVEVPVPRPVGEQVLLRVDAAGLCHSDLHVIDSAPGRLPYELPFTLGHEVVGTVVAVGEDAGGGWLGRLCAVYGIWSCGTCRNCLRGRENYCFALTGAIGGGIGRDGGLADYMLVPTTRHLVPADGGDPIRLAPLTDAGLTAFHALRPHRDRLAGAAVVVIGIGGLGHLALQLLAAAPVACLVAVDPRREARDLATRLGATHVVPSAGDGLEQVRVATGPEGADLVLDFVGTEETLTAAARLLGPGGRVVLVGSAGGRLTVSKGADLPRGWGVEAPFWGTREDLAAVVALADAGQLHAETETYRLEEAVVAYERLRSGAVRGRAVVVPGG